MERNIMCGCAALLGLCISSGAAGAQPVFPGQAAEAPQVMVVPMPTGTGNAAPGVSALTLGECWRLGGTVTVDNSCPQTSADSPFGGTIVGRFRCTALASICVDESMAR